METMSNLAGVASKAIWGDNKNSQEPLSGVQGDPSKGEPFDKGNLEEPEVTHNEFREEPRVGGGGGGGDDDEHAEQAEPKLNGSSKNEDVEFSKTTGTAAESAEVPDNEQTNLKARDAPADTTKGQNDTRDPEDPQTNPKNNPTDVDDTGDGPNEGQKLEGPGPRPVEEVAREHGGDAGNVGGHDGKAQSGGDDGSKGGDEEVDPNDPRAKSTGEGTGEKYVKSTGLAADGGDFDATKPGAGKEADRLLAEKGIHRDAGGAKGAPTESTGEKKKLTERIKEKFHRT